MEILETSKLDEQQLIEQLSNGDSSAYEIVIREYGGYLLGVARQYSQSPADAQDIVQESYLQLFKNIAGFRGESSLKSWLHRVTINNALMKIRKESKTNEALSEVENESHAFDENGKRKENLENISMSADDVYASTELRSTVKEKIMSLPIAYRNILLLRDIEGYSITETAELLEISPASVKTGLHRARNKLKTLLEKSDY